jgi:alanyl-tRNA synthetase
MDAQAKVSSIDALESFRADLIRFIEKAKVALEGAEGEVRRTRTWLDVDRTNHWKTQMKERLKQLNQAEAEHYNARITRPTENHAYHKMAVAKAERRVAEADEKLKVLKRWSMQYDNLCTPLVRRLDPAFHMVGNDLPKGVHMLGESIKALQAYAEKSGGAKPAAPNAGEGGEP